tara:strand:+ start:876 stop:1343 length:468 start_codon:yes stop_codon:yes gene_type:complete
MRGNLHFKIAEILGTVFYTGRLPFAPGTWGSVFALLTWYYIKPKIIDPLFLLITGGLFFLGIAVTETYLKYSDEKDPKEIVIDEWVGMWIALYLVPHSLLWGLTSFLFFRIFDIFKPGPIQSMDEMEGPLGVMLDDAVAGIITCLLIQSLVLFNR